MRYRKPFTPEQRRDAANKYRSYRRNYRQLRARYAPQTRKQRALLAEYRDIVQAFGAEVAGPTVDPEQLNDLDVKAIHTVFEYMSSRWRGG